MGSDDKIIYTLKSKLMPEATGPYQILDSNAYNVTIEEDGISNTLSVDRVTLAPTRSTDQTPPEKGAIPSDYSSTQIEKIEGKPAVTLERNPISDTPLSKEKRKDKSAQQEKDDDPRTNDGRQRN